MPCCQFRKTSPTLCRGTACALSIDPLHDGVSTSMVVVRGLRDVGLLCRSVWVKSVYSAIVAPVLKIIAGFLAKLAKM